MEIKWKIEVYAVVFVVFIVIGLWLGRDIHMWRWHGLDRCDLLWYLMTLIKGLARFQVHTCYLIWRGHVTVFLWSTGESGRIRKGWIIWRRKGRFRAAKRRVGLIWWGLEGWTPPQSGIYFHMGEEGNYSRSKTWSLAYFHHLPFSLQSF